MAFDVYAGPLTRFYRRDWENVGQRMSREQGTKYNMIYAGGPPPPPPSADELRKAIAGWCQAMSAALKPHVVDPISWDESDRPGWEGYSALLMLAAHTEHPELPLPAEAHRHWADDPAFARSTAPDYRSRFATILQPELWIPARFEFTFDGPTLVLEKARIGSVFKLKDELERLDAESKASLQALIEGSATPPTPHEVPAAQPPQERRRGLLSRMFSKEPAAKQASSKPQPPPFAETASFALAVFRRLADEACRNRWC